MNTKYKFLDNERIYYVRFAPLSWVDVFTRLSYIDILLQPQEKSDKITKIKNL